MSKNLKEAKVAENPEVWYLKKKEPVKKKEKGNDENKKKGELSERIPMFYLC